jgi:predicted DNA-binding transcriptional regulator AlpA
MSRGKKIFFKPEEQDQNRQAKPPGRFPERPTTGALNADHRIDKLADTIDQAKETRPPLASPEVRLLSKAEVIRRTGRTFPTIWRWMRQGRFPRARDLNGRPVWPEPEINEFIAALPIRTFKEDETSKTATDENHDETRD